MCKICGTLFSPEGNRFTSIKLRCPYCSHTLVPKKDRKHFIVHKCINPKCPYYLRNLKKVDKKDLKEEKKIVAVVFAVIAVCCVVVLCLFFLNNSKEPGIVHTLADDQIGISLPKIVYADTDTCIFYDYHGVFVYDLNSGRTSDFVSFSENGFSNHIEGDDATFVYSGDEGREIYITNTSNKLFTYDINKKKGELSDKSFDSIPENSIDKMEYSETNDESDVSGTYILPDNSKMYWTIDAKKDDEVTYSDIRLNINKKGKDREYTIFK